MYTDMEEEVFAKRMGAVRPDPVLFSDVRTTKDPKQVRAILGDELYNALFTEGVNALLSNPAVNLGSGAVKLWPVLVFNTAEQAIFYLYDTLEAPVDGPEPQSWRKKLPVDGGVLFRKAFRLCGWK